VVDGETILWKGIEDIKLADIKKGDKAEIGYYTDDAGKLVASWVDVIVPEQPAAIDTQANPVSQTAPTVPAAPEEE
jgi:multidrug resistance efflux pump